VSLYNAAYTIGTKIVNGVIDFAESLPGKVGDIISNMIGIIKGAATSAFNEMKNIGESLWNGFKKGIGISSPSFIERAMDQVTANMADNVSEIQRHVGALQSLGATLPGVVPSPALSASVVGLAGVPAAVASGATGGSSVSYQIDKIEIPAKDLAEMKDVSDFFDRLQSEARKRTGANAK
jgi:hypothetical protein